MEGGDNDASANMDAKDSVMAEADKEPAEGTEKKEQMIDEGEKVDEKVIHKILIPGVSKVYSSQEEAVAAL